MNTLKILLADDDAEDRFIMREAFGEAGLEGITDFVEDGEKVFSFLEERADEELPSVIILDLNMPRMSGTQTLERLKQLPRYIDIPVIIFSTSHNDIERRECRQLGALSYIIKPTSFDKYKELAQQFYDFCNKEYSFPSA